MTNSYSVRVFAVMLLLFCLSACELDPGRDKEDIPEEYYPVIETITDAVSSYGGTSEPVQKINFSGDTASLAIPGLTGQNVFLIKVNRSQDTAEYVDTGDAWSSETGRRTANRAAKSLEISRTGTGKASGFFPGGVVRMDHEEAQRFNRNPPPMEERGFFRPFRFRAAEDIVDETSREFWVEGAEGNWVQITAVLRESGSKCKVWVAEDNFAENSSSSDSDNKITSEKAEKIAEKFDEIYDYTTAIFGYEYGGGGSSSDPSYGGVDGDPAIQILLYDIDGDYSPEQYSGVMGYFWSKDAYTDQELSEYGLKTNLSEIFYIDAHFTDRYENTIYSTLVHEFQHMIHFNEKSIIHGESSDTWYNEMLSMLAEDMISPLIEISPGSGGHPVDQRMRDFLAGYNLAGITEWLEDDSVYFSYSNVYAFGAFLARNFGGAALVQAIASNSLVNVPSVSEALHNINPVRFPSEGSAFTDALGLYGQAMVYSGSRKPSGVFSFDKADTKRINGTDYTFEGFDIWEIDNPLAGILNLPQGYTGPLVWDLHTYRSPMRGNSVLLQSYPEWQGKTGDLTIEFERPGSPDIDLCIMIR